MGRSHRRRACPREPVLIRVAVIGYGYWGPNVARNLAETPGVEVAAIVDRDPERRAVAARHFPGAIVTGDLAPGLLDVDVDAVAVATPVSTHRIFAESALRAGKHVLVEKPLAASVAEAEMLTALAAASGLVLLVDHTFLYTGAVRKMRDIVADGSLGDVLYVDSVRVNLGLFQSDIDVLWDLAPHDVSILRFLFDRAPEWVSAVGADPLQTGHCSTVYLTCSYGEGVLAHVHVNWLSPVKVRRMLVGGSRKMIVYDDTEPSEKVRVYDRGAEISGRDGMYAAAVDYRSGDVVSPKLDAREALAVECEYFAALIEAGEPAPAGEGVDVVRVLEAASRSLLRSGDRVYL